MTAAPTFHPLSWPAFRRIAANGFGDGWNSCAHSMAWFRKGLYVGTSRATLGMVKVNANAPTLDPWPIDVPADLYKLDRRAQIWRYDPGAGSWTLAFVSPMAENRSGDLVPRDIGYRGMCVASAEGQPSLYVCTWSPSKGTGPRILRTTDGSAFDELPIPPLGDSGVNTFRALVSHRGRLFTAPTGRTSGYGMGDETAANIAVIFESVRPDLGEWSAACPAGFDDPGNLTIFELASFNGFLYAGTLNPSTGCQVWRTTGDRPPYTWKKVVTEGGYRGPINELCISMAVFRGSLYVGTGIVMGGYDRRRKIGPAAPEILRVNADDSWDIVVGEPRRTPDGLKTPISGLGPGFGNPFNGYVWKMEVHDGNLYAGTYDWSVLLPYLPRERWPWRLLDAVELMGAKSVAESVGGFDLWSTADGLHWTPITQAGFGNPFNWGLRTMTSTPAGLFVGTANPFAPRMATGEKRDASYHENPRGGLEVWVGRWPGGNRSRYGRRTPSRSWKAPILVLAPPRSYTSLIGAMMGQHPALYALPEIHLFVADRLSDLEFLYQHRGERRRDGLLRVLAQVLFGAQTEETIRLAFNWYRKRRHMSTAELFYKLAQAFEPLTIVEKSVSTVWNIDNLKRAARTFPHARYVHLTRHPRSNCESLLETAFSRAVAHGPYGPGRQRWPRKGRPSDPMAKNSS